MKQKLWIAVIVLAVAAVGLSGGIVAAAALPRPEDRQEDLAAELEALMVQKEELNSLLDERGALVAGLREDVERQEAQYVEVESNLERYHDLNDRWAELTVRLDALKNSIGVSPGIEYAMPPNYDRRCLTYLQSGNAAASGIAGLLGGILGNAFGNQLNNSSQEDVGKLHSAVNALTDEINDAVQQAERSLAAYQAGKFLLDQVYDPAMTGEGLAGQIAFLEQMYQEDPELRAAALHDVSYAVITLRYAGEVYATFLSKGAERTGYLDLMSANRRDLEAVLSNHGVTAEQCLTREELDGICQSTAGHQREIGELVQNSQVWLDVRTMQSDLLSTGSGMVGSHKMLVTYQTDSNRVLYATDPKGGVTAFYGFAETGEPMSFTRGSDMILFDWNAGDGTALYTTMTDQETRALYAFAAFLRDNRNGFRKAQYDRYQTVY